MKVTILGAGAWGRIIGGLLEKKGNSVSYLHHTDTSWPAGDPSLVILGLRAQGVRATIKKLPRPACPVLSLCKGLEIATGSRVSEIIRQEWGNETGVAALSGPTLAHEVQRGLPTAAVIAADQPDIGAFLAEALHVPQFRIYHSTDLAGVEWGGALKNVYAIAAGVCAGLKLGENAQAALITRCLAEMARIGQRAGGRAETFAGLSGVGDLLLTANSPQSRNHRVGVLLSEGLAVADILPMLDGVAEGVSTALAIFNMESIPAEAKPVAMQVHAMLHEGKSPRDSVRDLLSRSIKAE